MAALAPLWLMPLAALLGRVFCLDYSNGKLVKRGLSILAIVSIVFSSLWMDATYLKAFNGPVKSYWDMGSNELVAVLKKEIDENSNRPVVCVDWGLGTIVYAHLHDRANIQDNWPWFKDGLSEPELEYYEREIIPHKPIFIVPAEGVEAFPETRSNFFYSAEARHWKLDRIYEIRRQNGDVIYELYVVENGTLYLPVVSNEQ
jgi:hypothetical protein